MVYGKNFTIIRDIIVGILLFLIILFYFVGGIDRKIFQPDENYWYRSSHYFKLFFIEKDFYNIEWGSSGHYPPPVGKYIVGFTLLISGQKNKISGINPELHGWWNFEKSFDWNIVNTPLPPDDVVYPLRFVMSVFVSLTCLIVYLIGEKTLGFTVGIVAAILMACNYLTLRFAHIIMAEAILVFFMTLSILFMIYFYEMLIENKVVHYFLIAILLGISLSLAAGTKMNGVISAIIFTVFCLCLTCYRRFRTENKTIFFGWAIAFTFAWVIFTILNPYLYDKLFNGPLVVLQNTMEAPQSLKDCFLSNEISSFKVFYPATALDSLSSKIYFVFNRVIRNPDFTQLELYIRPIIFILGFILLVYNEIKCFYKRREFSSCFIILLWVFITFVAITSFIVMDLDRYYYPLIPCFYVILGYGVDRFIYLGRRVATLCFRYMDVYLNNQSINKK